MCIFVDVFFHLKDDCQDFHLALHSSILDSPSYTVRDYHIADLFRSTKFPCFSGKSDIVSFCFDSYDANCAYSNTPTSCV